MPSPTYVALAKTVLTSNQASVTISSIPNTYTDLLLLISARQTNTSGAYVGTAKVELNGVSSNHSYREVLSTGTTASSVFSTTTAFILRYPADGSTPNVFGNTELYIPNYRASTSKLMSASNVAENNSSTDGQSRIAADAGLWVDNSAITEIIFTPSTGQIASGSRFDLYGIKNS